MGEFFGTDGIRGRANQYPLTPEAAVTIGKAIGKFFDAYHRSAPIIMGRDTRISGRMLEAAVSAGICAVGGDVVSAGTIPTPAVAYLSKSLNAAAGVVISASHNPYDDNGIKLFGPDGYKLTEDQETQIEGLIHQALKDDAPFRGDRIGNIRSLNSARQRYHSFLRQTMPDTFSLQGIKICIDCSNGATSAIAPEIFRDYGADLTVLFNTPNGTNINAGCGSEHPESLARKVVEKDADVGLAFDGDGDRLIVVDELGHRLTGDQILAISARFLKSQNKLRNNMVVSTVMSNLGLQEALHAMGVSHQTCQVGDRFVMEAMRSSDAVLGGEDSGHMIHLIDHSTGDGLLSALKLLEAMQGERQKLSELAKVMAVYPQVLQNVAVIEKPDLAGLEAVQQAIADAQTQLGDRGRVLVRYSGTQAVCRVMVEGPSDEVARESCRAIALAVERVIGE
jgi:phosphoglucosamine mutase